MNFCVGLTGNIASGKTSVAALFSKKNIDSFSADSVAKDLTNNPSILTDITAHFGHSILMSHGQLNRKKLREIIFSNPTEKKWLENLLHPHIRTELEKKVSLSKTPYCIVEIPLLTDKIEYSYLNRILLVTAPIELQIERVISRDHCTRTHALDILAAQPDVNERMRFADDVICNDLDLAALSKQVNRLHDYYLAQAMIR